MLLTATYERVISCGVMRCLLSDAHNDSELLARGQRHGGERRLRPHLQDGGAIGKHRTARDLAALDHGGGARSSGKQAQVEIQRGEIRRL